MRLKMLVYGQSGFLQHLTVDEQAVKPLHISGNPINKSDVSMSQLEKVRKEFACAAGIGMDDVIELGFCCRDFDHRTPRFTHIVGQSRRQVLGGGKQDEPIYRLA